jgi:hypothetical protein
MQCSLLSSALSASLRLLFPKVEARPGVAPGKAGLQPAGSTTSPCAPCVGGTGGFCPRATTFTESDAAITIRSPSEMGPLAGLASPVQSGSAFVYAALAAWRSRPHKPVYKTGAFLCRPQGSVEMVFPAGFAPAASTFAKWCAASYTSGTWCGMPVPMPVPPRRSLCGRQPCSLLHQYRLESFQVSVGRVQAALEKNGRWSR